MTSLSCVLTCVQIIYVEATDGAEDLVVISPQWLCSDVIGQLLSHDQVTQCRPIGRFSLDEVHLMFADSSSVVKLVGLLETMELCSPVVEDAETLEFEFMSLNFVEAPDHFVGGDVDSLADSDWVYGGTRLVGSRSIGLQLTSVFPRVQTRLRRQLDVVTGSLDADLDQWYGGSRIMLGAGSVQLVLSASVDSHTIDIKCRATPDCRLSAFRLSASVVHLVTEVLADSLPSLAVEQQTLSVANLSTSRLVVAAYAPRDVRCMLDGSAVSENVSSAVETIVDLLAFGSDSILEMLTPSTLLPLSVGLSVSTRRALAKILDQPHPTGHDWCMLSVLLGLDHKEIASAENRTEPSGSRSPTDQCLALWIRRDGDAATVLSLASKLSALNRPDAVDCMLAGLPVFVHKSSIPAPAQ